MYGFKSEIFETKFSQNYYFGLHITGSFLKTTTFGGSNLLLLSAQKYYFWLHKSSISLKTTTFGWLHKTSILLITTTFGCTKLEVISQLLHLVAQNK